MSYKDDYFKALDDARLFQSAGHRTRFKELMDCYAGYPFFTKGLCKCIFLSSWDEEHFVIMLETLTDMTLGKERDIDEMMIKGDALADEQKDEQFYIYQLSSAFLSDQPFALPENVKLSDEFQYIMDVAQKAAVVIDGM
ncbi:MAG: hypothetical protein ACI39W_01920 [Brotaphodocola sp.]